MPWKSRLPTWLGCEWNSHAQHFQSAPLFCVCKSLWSRVSTGACRRRFCDCSLHIELRTGLPYSAYFPECLSNLYKTQFKFVFSLFLLLILLIKIGILVGCVDIFLSFFCFLLPLKSPQRPDPFFKSSDTSLCNYDLVLPNHMLIQPKSVMSLKKIERLCVCYHMTKSHVICLSTSPEPFDEKCTKTGSSKKAGMVVWFADCYSPSSSIQ